MEMKGVCNEFHSARVPDPTAISQFGGENQRDRERVERRGSGMEERRDSRENTALFFSFFFFFTPPSSFSAWLPGCYNVKLAFLSVYREQCGTVTWSKRGEGNGIFSGGEGGERGRRHVEEKDNRSGQSKRTGEVMGLNREQRDTLDAQHEHMGD